ncbi:MAG: hypothetical protein EOO61_21540, partial [Hymenobacter sp.]
AVNPLPFGPAVSSDVSIAYFSSIGPTDDGRIKPDICGDGVNVISVGTTAADAYVAMSGTSMATPNVSGSIFLLQEYFAQKNSGNFMRAATLKGLVCHTAFDAGNIGPDYIYGWGLLNATKAAQAITDNGVKSIISENTLAQGQTQTFNVVASGSGPLVATISWTDPAGTPGAVGVVDDPSIKLVNDLDVRVTQSNTVFRPYILDPANPATAATTGDNIRDNIEQIYIANAVPGKSYTISINLDNHIQADLFISMLPELLAHLRQTLQNWQIQIEHAVVIAEIKKMIYSPQDKFNYLAEKNPALHKLRQALGMEVDY